MSKQQGYQSLNTEVPNVEDYGFAARLPQAGGSSYPTDSCARDAADLKGTGTTSGGATGMAYPVAYPAAAYAGAQARAVEGYPAMPMSMSTGPVGMVVQDPLGMGMYGRNACAANGCHGCRRRRGGPVHLLFRLARSAFHTAQNHHRKQPPAPALN